MAYLRAFTKKVKSIMAYSMPLIPEAALPFMTATVKGGGIDESPLYKPAEGEELPLLRGGVVTWSANLCGFSVGEINSLAGWQ